MVTGAGPIWNVSAPGEPSTVSEPGANVKVSVLPMAEKQLWLTWSLMRFTQTPGVGEGRVGQGVVEAGRREAGALEAGVEDVGPQLRAITLAMSEMMSVPELAQFPAGWPVLSI